MVLVPTGGAFFTPDPNKPSHSDGETEVLGQQNTTPQPLTVGLPNWGSLADYGRGGGTSCGDYSWLLGPAQCVYWTGWNMLGNSSASRACPSLPHGL